MVYELVFFYWDDDPQNDDYVIIAVYSSYELAERGLEKFAEQPRFKGKKEALYICKYKINEEDSFWPEGFFTPGPTYFGIDLSGDYLLKKYEDNDIAIRVQNNTEDLFNGKMHYYQDFETCLLLKNEETEKMYCFDKEKKAMVTVTENVEEFLEYLGENYSIDKVKWGLIEE